tara:strand:+ start:114 stop:506 length:393 start_codon:yes stop_codon:yes gene_type:complete
MAKKRLTDLCREYGIHFSEAKDIVDFQFEESMVTGKGKNTWINERGQALFDDLVPIDIIYRGRVLYPAPNDRYVIAYIKELTQKVAVQVPVRFSKTLTNKIIYIQADNTGPNAKYTWMKTPRSHNLKYYG